MKFSGRILSLTVFFAAVALPAARASFHFIEVNEVYSSADGSVQYVELISKGPGQTNLGPTRVVARNADGTVSTLVVNFSATFTGSLNNGDTLLIATPAFESVAGFAPDFVMSACSLISTPAGRVTFQGDAGSIVDAVAFGAYTGSNTGFGTPAAALPTDGANSLTRISTVLPKNNSVNFAVRPATPRRNNGTTTTLTGDTPNDCDASNAADACEIAAGGLDDENGNDVPDAQRKNRQ